MQFLKRLIVITFAVGAVSYYAFSNRATMSVHAKFLPAPPVLMTGAPGEGTCLGCHYTYGGPDINNPIPNLGSGKVEILGLPSVYTPGQNYTVTVRVSDPTARRWGFELTAIDVNGTSTTVGALTITNSGITVKQFGSLSPSQQRTYISHNQDGTFSGQAGSGSWSFTWTAPAATVGKVTFYAAGNAANNQVTPEDDYIYTTMWEVSAPSANHPPTFAATTNRVLGIGDRVSFTVSASDQDNDPMTISASELANATFDPGNNRFTFTPAADQIGTQQVTFTASDGKSQTQQSVSLQVMTENSQALAGLSKTGVSKYLDSSSATQIDLTVLGTFDAGAEIIFNGLPMTTQSVQGGLAASLPASALTAPGAYPVRVRAGSTLTNARALALAATINPQTAATTDAATFSATVAPGQIASLFGLNLVVGSGTGSASALPLPRSLQSTTVYVNGVPAPLFFTFASQINYQMPYSTAVGQASVVVMRDDGVAAYGTVDIAVAVPALFTTNQGGSGQAVAINLADFSFNGDPAVNPQAKRAKKGDYITLYGSGTGAQFVIFGTSQPLLVNDGEAAVALAITATKPTITIGDKPVNINDQFFFSGLAPGFVGLWQLNLPIPTDAPSGASVSIVITHNGVISKTVTIAIE